MLRLVFTNFDRIFHVVAKRISKPFQEYAAGDRSGCRAVGIRDVECWRMPFPLDVSEQLTWSRVVREAQTQACISLIIYLHQCLIPTKNERLELFMRRFIGSVGRKNYVIAFVDCP